MMPLRDFLSAHNIVIDIEDYNARILRLDYGDKALRICIVAEPWWRSTTLEKSEGRLEIELTDIVQSDFHLSEYPITIDDLEVRTSGHALRELGMWVDIFGASAVSDPERFFVEFHDLTKEIWALQEPIEYTPFATFALFKKYVTEPSYMLLSAPQEIADIAKRLLDAQGVRYTYLLKSKPRHVDHDKLIEVQIGESWVVCRDALVSAD